MNGADTGNPTIPARDSFEELQYELVRRSIQGIDEARENVARYRVLLGGAK